MILLRTTDLAAATLTLADTLEAASGLPVVMLIDERNGPVDADGRRKLGFDRRTYAGLGLYTPPDVGWRCGDYGFYLARRTHPEVERFWMIDYDVLPTGDAGEFFRAADSRKSIDLLAARLQPAEDAWWWTRYLAASDARPWRCFFPVVRLSARAIDVLYEKRRAHSRKPSRIAMWPNDEGFVATTVVDAGLGVADLNDLGQRFYDDATFSYDNVIDGDRVAPRTGPPELLHPVLTGEAYARKIARMAQSSHYPDLPFLRIRQSIAPRINRRRAW